MLICRALIKHDYSNFSLIILEYCSPDKCLERESYYLKLLKPEYNSSQNPSAPFFWRKHYKETRKKISDTQMGNINGFKKGQSKPLPPSPIFLYTLSTTSDNTPLSLLLSNIFISNT